VSSPSVGQVIGGYRLDALIGRGGMGVVFRATHIALDRQGAVKLIAPELAANEEFRVRFQRESRLAASIDHAHVIPVFDAMWRRPGSPRARNGSIVLTNCRTTTESRDGGAGREASRATVVSGATT
jgi:serine/threonine protein kinase